jgi:hypothetical protein
MIDGNGEIGGCANGGIKVSPWNGIKILPMLKGQRENNEKRKKIETL